MPLLTTTTADDQSGNWSDSVSVNRINAVRSYIANTFDIIGKKVQAHLDDQSAGFFTPTDITDSLQDGYNYVTCLTECIEKIATVDFVAGLCYYNFPNLIPDFGRVFGIFNNDTNRWMEPIGNIELYKLRDDYELTNGEPYWFQPISYQYVMIYPAPAAVTSGQKMTVMYKATAPTISGDLVPNIPSQHQTALEYYSTKDLLTQCEEFYKALKWNELLGSEVEHVRKYMRERTSPNTIYYFKP